MTTGPGATTTGGGAGVELIDVAKRFDVPGGFTEAVSNVTLRVAPGEFVSMVGPSGCGKTTVARMVSDLIPPSEGTITVDGQSPSAARRDRQFGFVFQRATLLEWRDLLGNVALPLDVLRWPRQQRRDRALELLDLVGLRDFAHHRPDEVSGGMQQRVAIARALSFDPGILIMDEPFGALDMITRDQMGFELLRIWEEARKTVLFITHSIEEAVLLSDRVVVMSNRPSIVQDVVTVDLERPRSVEHRHDPRFVETSRRLREMLEAG